MNQVSRFVALALVALGLAGARPAFGQSTPVTVTDQRLTQQVIRSIEKLAESTDVGLARLEANVNLLLTRLDASGASDMRLTEVAAFYTKSVTATRFRQEARVNAQANRQLLRLRAKANAEAVIASLEDARDVALAQIIASEADALASIAASLAAVVTP